MVRIRFKRCFAAGALGFGLLASAAQAAPLQVFACEPEWGALVQALLPDAQITVATHARQDPHHIEARPALMSALRRAQLAVCTGASLEAGWLPMLQQRASNPAVRDGQPGMFYAAEQVALIDPRPSVGLNDGDVHPEGNPHLHLDPQRLMTVAQALARRLAHLDPAQAASIQARHAAWHADFNRRWHDWQQRAAPLKGRRVVAQHSTFAYLWRWTGVQVVADLEPKPGLPPTPSHLQAVLSQVRAQPAIAAVHALYQDPQPSQWLARQLGAGATPALALPSTVTDEGAASSLAGLFDGLLDSLLKAAASAR